MKILHTADLHIGKQVHGFSMTADQEHILGLIIARISEEKPDVFIISGDVYDKQVPSAESVSVFDRFITSAAEICPNLLLIPGNHDSPERLGFASKLLERRGVYFAVKPVKITIQSGRCEADFYLCPFTKPSFARGVFPDCKIDSAADAVALVLDSFNINPDRINILAAHQSFIAAGESLAFSESEMGCIGGTDIVNTAVLQKYSLDYAALGHLHGAQSTLVPHFRYSGSPLKYSFSEHLHKKSVTKVEIEEKGQAGISALPLPPLRDMRKIKGGFDILVGMEPSEDYVHITYTDEEEVYDAIGKIRAVYPNVMQIDHEKTKNCVEQGLSEVPDMKTPFEMFMEFFAMQSGRELTSEQEEIVKEILNAEEGS